MIMHFSDSFVCWLFLLLPHPDPVSPPSKISEGDPLKVSEGVLAINVMLHYLHSNFKAGRSETEVVYQCSLVGIYRVITYFMGYHQF